MLKAYCNALHPRTGQLRDACCYWQVEGYDRVTFTVSAENNYPALAETVLRLLRWSASEHVTLLIHVTNKAIPNNRDLIRLCGQTGSDIVWLPKEQYIEQYPEAPESKNSTGLRKGNHVGYAATPQHP